jgi:hypothetical protein
MRACITILSTTSLLTFICAENLTANAHVHLFSALKCLHFTLLNRLMCTQPNSYVQESYLSAHVHMCTYAYTQAHIQICICIFTYMCMFPFIFPLCKILSFFVDLAYLFIFIRYFIYISNVSPFPSSPPPAQKSPILSPLPLLPNTPTPASWPRQSPISGHRTFTEPRASPPIDNPLGHPLLHMQTN